MPPNRRTRRAGGIRRKHRHHLPPGEIADGLKLAAAGLVLGLTGAFYGTKLLQRSLYGMRAVDPASLAVVAALLLAAAVTACIIPAWRAASVDPLRSLRE